MFNMMMEKKCANRECGSVLYDWNNTLGDDRYCDDCAAVVYAFCPNKDDGQWFFIAEDGDDLANLTPSGEQCQGCGLTGYSTIADKDGKFWVMCVGEGYDDEYFEGCNATYPIRRMASREVVF